MKPIHVVELDSTGNFDTTFPLCLQGYLSPQEYQFVIHKASEAQAKNYETIGMGMILLVVVMFIFFTINVGVAFLIVWAFRHSPVKILLSVGVQVMLVFLLGLAVVLGTKKRQLSITQEFNNEMELYNQNTLQQRGLLVRSRREGSPEKVYIEFLQCEKPKNDKIILKSVQQTEQMTTTVH